MKKSATLCSCTKLQVQTKGLLTCGGLHCYNVYHQQLSASKPAPKLYPWQLDMIL